jgi:hypothetical protein
MIHLKTKAGASQKGLMGTATEDQSQNFCIHDVPDIFVAIRIHLSDSDGACFTILRQAPFGKPENSVNI